MRRMNVDTNSVLESLLQEEIQYFYKYIRNYDESRRIDTIIADNMYERILEYDMCDTQKAAVINTGIELNNSNGTVIFAPSREKTTLVVLSKLVLPQKDLDEVHGTVLHELTHAHDFYDFADFLQIRDYNEVFNSSYYHAFFFWTEFHARRIGYKRFIEYKFRKSWKQFKKHRYEFLEGIKANFLVHSTKGRLYDLMQTMGRYYAFTELCSSYTGNFEEDILQENVKLDMISIINDIYIFLANNTEFEVFKENIVVFDELLKKLESMLTE